MKSFSEALSDNVALRLGAGRLDRMQVVSSSYGNDSLAVVQWCAEQGFENVHVVFIDTGWSAEGWLDRVAEAEQWVRSLGFTAHRIDPVVKFEELIESRHGFPNQRYQWCSAHLKGIPFLEWIDTVDPDFTSTVMIGKRREESRERAATQEWTFGSEYHGGRTVRCPIYLHTEDDRNRLLRRTPFQPLPHRSQECAPCVNANRQDMLLLGETEIARVECLEFEVEHNMFRPKRHMGAIGIRQVVRWAKSAKGKFVAEPSSVCSSGYCGF